MLRLGLYLVLVLLATPASAQPSAADSALVDRLVESLQLDQANAIMGQLGDGVEREIVQQDLGAVGQDMGAAMGSLFRMDPAAIADSLRALLFEDFRPAEIREALAYLDGPIPQRMMELSAFVTDSLDIREMMAMLEDPGDRPLADSALSARYAAALQSANQPPDIQERMVEELMAMFPPDLREAMDQALAPLGGFDAMLRQQRQAAGPEQERMMLTSARLSLALMDEADIRATTAYYESDAGRYVSRQMALVMMRVQLPHMVEAMRPMFSMLAEQMRAATDVPSPRDTVEMVEVQPELIGGMAALSRAVVYPEQARREGVEGRVVVRFVVDERGEVMDATVASSPNDLLSEAALAAVRQQRFVPGQVRGRPVKVRFVLPVTFRLPDSEADAGGRTRNPLPPPPGLDPPRPPRRPPPPYRASSTKEPEIFEVAEIQPQLIGGIESLSGAIVYPEEARREGVEGRVIVQFVVDERGGVTDVTVVRSPNDLLSEAAIAAARQLRFTPGMDQGRPVKVRFALPVVFRLNDDEPEDGQ